MGAPEEPRLPASPTDGARATPDAIDLRATRPDETTFAVRLAPATPPVASPAPSADARYERLDTCGQGGMGRIWVARDKAMERDIALKELHYEYIDNPAALARFLKEARITGQLEHPGVVPVYEVVKPSG